jgi:hypothetical protein
MPNFIEIGLVVWISIPDTHTHTHTHTHINFYILDMAMLVFKMYKKLSVMLLGVHMLSIMSPQLSTHLQLSKFPF